MGSRLCEAVGAKAVWGKGDFELHAIDRNTFLPHLAQPSITSARPAAPRAEWRAGAPSRPAIRAGFIGDSMTVKWRWECVQTSRAWLTGESPVSVCVQISCAWLAGESPASVRTQPLSS